MDGQTNYTDFGFFLPFESITYIFDLISKFVFFQISSSKIQERSWLEAEGGKVDLNSGEMENNVKVI